MRLLYVPLRPAMLTRLCQLAEEERREPREQAAYLLERALTSMPPSEPTGIEEARRDAEPRPATAFSRSMTRLDNTASDLDVTSQHGASCRAYGLVSEEASNEPGT